MTDAFFDNRPSFVCACGHKKSRHWNTATQPRGPCRDCGCRRVHAGTDVPVRPREARARCDAERPVQGVLQMRMPAVPANISMRSHGRTATPPGDGAREGCAEQSS